MLKNKHRKDAKGYVHGSVGAKLADFVGVIVCHQNGVIQELIQLLDSLAFALHETYYELTNEWKETVLGGNHSNHFLCTNSLADFGKSRNGFL